MSHTLLALLGAMLVNERFRRALAKGDRYATLSERGFFLTRGEREIFERMMESFESGKLDEACKSIQSQCPIWPCSFFSID